MSNAKYLAPNAIRSVAVIGTGAVGANWSALFLAKGMDVYAYDPAPTAEQRAKTLIAAAWPALVQLDLTRTAQPPFEKLRFMASAGDAAAQADLVQENTPEKPELKARVLAEVDAAAGPGKIIMSSTGGIPPTTLQVHCTAPERLVVVHPFNPSHLVPLVEIVGGEKTSVEAIDWAMDFARYMGKEPIRLHAEANGHMTNRLQFALVREAVACLLDGIASAKDIDAAVRFGLGPRWTLMGSLLTLHLAGGAGGMRGILDHAGKAIEEWWTPRGQPSLTSDVKDRLVAAGAEVSAGRPVGDWEGWRDRGLVQVIKLQQAGIADEPGQIQGHAQ